MLRYVLTVCLIGLTTSKFGSCTPQEEERLILNELLEKRNYDKRVRPSATGGKGPTTVEVNLYVRHIEQLDEMNGEYGVHITFRQKWNDNRLTYNSTADLPYLSLLEVDEVWRPDTFFANEIESTLHSLMTPNNYIRIFPNGQILHSTRLSLKLRCTMVFRTFPFDDQTCNLRLASYGSTTKDIIYDWKETDPTQIKSDIHLPKFSLDKLEVDKCDSTTNTGVYSCLRLYMFFSRELSSYLRNIFTPCAMMVIAAWIGTFLNKNFVSARVITALSSLYVMATQVSDFNKTIPTTTYTKAIDIWTGTCLTFVFSTFIQFVIVKYVSKSEEQINEDEAINDGKLPLVDTGRQTSFVKWFGKAPSRLSDKIETVFRILYPTAFILFLIVYLSVFY